MRGNTVPISVDVLKFLHGVGSLEGLYFGDSCASKAGFWWREYLPKIPKQYRAFTHKDLNFHFKIGDTLSKRGGPILAIAGVKEESMLLSDGSEIHFRALVSTDYSINGKPCTVELDQ